MRLFAAAVILFGSTVVHRGMYAAEAGQDGAAPLSSSDANALIHRRCDICHSGAQAKGGLNLETFDARVPDAAVARLMLVKIEADNAMTAAGQPFPDASTIAAIVTMLRVAAAPNDASTARWKVDLEAIPGRGHALVSASTRSDAGPVRFTCNGITRTFLVGDSASAQVSPDLTGLSPIVRRVFDWCLESPQPQRTGTPQR
jgi:hypothetical protein